MLVAAIDQLPAGDVVGDLLGLPQLQYSMGMVTLLEIPCRILPEAKNFQTSRDESRLEENF